MKSTLYSASARGHANHGWLDTHHTFSFANWYNPERINFGALRVVNDDIVLGAEGFDTHPHDNMEIISIPLYGALAHKDSMGHIEVIRAGEVQVMSAGTGITHSEYNAHPKDPVNFFQIWVFTDKKNHTPRYETRDFNYLNLKNELIQIVGPKDDPANTGLWINQDAWFSIGTFHQDHEIDYKLKKKGHGLFAMVVEGEFTIEGQKLHHRDALGLWETDNVKIKSDTEEARILLIEVPMEF